MDIYGGLFLPVEIFICLKGNKNLISYSTAFEDHVCRSQLDYFSFDVVYHDFMFFSLSLTDMTIHCKIMIKIL